MPLYSFITTIEASNMIAAKNAAGEMSASLDEAINAGDVDSDVTVHTGDVVEATSALSLFTIEQLTTELRLRGLPTIVWQPGDMEGYGDPSVPLEDRLEECRKSLEDRGIEHGWEVIEAVLGHSPETEGEPK